MICACTLRASTPKCRLRSDRKRAVSGIVPEPITRLGESADVASVAHVSTSTGFVVISRMASGARAITCGTISRRIAAFRPSSCNRVSPGR
jgi:hypothetical protein